MGDRGKPCNIRTAAASPVGTAVGVANLGHFLFVRDLKLDCYHCFNMLFIRVHWKLDGSHASSAIKNPCMLKKYSNNYSGGVPPLLQTIILRGLNI